MANSDGKMRPRDDEPIGIPEQLNQQYVKSLGITLQLALRAGTAVPIQHNARFTDVLGNASAADAAQAIRVALLLGPSAMLPANHCKQDLPPLLQVGRLLLIACSLGTPWHPCTLMS